MDVKFPAVLGDERADVARLATLIAVAGLTIADVADSDPGSVAVLNREQNERAMLDAQLRMDEFWAVERRWVGHVSVQTAFGDAPLSRAAFAARRPPPPKPRARPARARVRPAVPGPPWAATYEAIAASGAAEP